MKDDIVCEKEVDEALKGLVSDEDQTREDIQKAQEEIDRKVADRAIFITERLATKLDLQLSTMSTDDKLELLGLAISLVE